MMNIISHRSPRCNVFRASNPQYSIRGATGYADNDFSYCHRHCYTARRSRYACVGLFAHTYRVRPSFSVDIRYSSSVFLLLYNNDKIFIYSLLTIVMHVMLRIIKFYLTTTLHHLAMVHNSPRHMTCNKCCATFVAYLITNFT